MKFTILLPTTGDRAALVELAIGSAIRQREQNFELHVVGDGVSAASAERLRSIAASDPLLHLHLYPKHQRRGEPYRHQVLTQARGLHVAYLLDRDLWLNDHLDVLASLLEQVDFAHTGFVAVEADGRLHRGIECQLALARHRRWLLARHCPIAMSTVGHRLAAYRTLPEGWRTTPPQHKTDHYMWNQFLAQAGLSACSSDRPTVLYFDRGGPDGWPPEQRRAELLAWSTRLPVLDAAWTNEIGASPGAWWRRRLRSILWWRPLLQRMALFPWPLIKRVAGLRRARAS